MQRDAVFVGVRVGRFEPSLASLLLDGAFLFDLADGGAVMRQVRLYRDRGQLDAGPGSREVDADLECTPSSGSRRKG